MVRSPHHSKPKLIRSPHGIRYSDINEMASLTLVPLEADHSLLSAHKSSNRVKKVSRRDIQTIDIKTTKHADRKFDEDDILKKQFSRFLYEMQS